MIDYLDDYEVWKGLIIAVIIRALMDIEEKSPSVAGSVDKQLYMSNMKRSAKRFISSEYCEFMAYAINVDISLIRSFNKLPEDMKQIQRHHLKNKLK